MAFVESGGFDVSAEIAKVAGKLFCEPALASAKIPASRQNFSGFLLQQETLMVGFVFEFGL